MLSTALNPAVSSGPWCAFLPLAPGCARAAAPPRATDDRARGEPAAVLGAGDVIEILFREPDLAGTYRISENGDLDFPLIGKVNLRDKTGQEVAVKIRSKLAQGYLRDPQVAVFAKEVNARKIDTLGRVNRAGTFGRGRTTWGAFARAVVEFLSLCADRRFPVGPISTADYPTLTKRSANYSELNTTRTERVVRLGPPPCSVSLWRVIDELFAPIKAGGVLS